MAARDTLAERPPPGRRGERVTAGAAGVRSSLLWAEAGSDRVSPLLRVIAAGVTLLLGSASVTLLVWPAETAERFAWPIAPSLTALVMGAGYAGGAVLFAAVTLRRRWHEVAIALPAITLFVVMTASTTILHLDRFTLGHPWFVAWVTLYGTTPVLLPILWLLNRSADPGPAISDRRRLAGPVRAVLVTGGVVELALAGSLLVAPDAVASVWPWALTPLTARVLGSWFAVAGGAAALAGIDGRWTAARLALVAGIVFAGLVLVGIARAGGDLDPSNPLAPAYVALVAASLIGFAGTWAWYELGRGAAGRA